LKIKKIYIIRHGQTDYNLKSVVQGKGIDASLNDTGNKQAKAFYDYYKMEGFEVLITSTLKRTTESVQSFIEDGLKPIKLAGIDEISWGVYEGVEANYEDQVFFKQLTGKWASGETSLAIDEGESPEEVALRQQEVIDIIKNREEEKILICMHGRALRIFLTQLLNLPIASMDQFEHTNLCLYKLEYRNNKFSLIESNSTKHLENN
jgi:2,3-bisphosphoglycerate-dependent phosphoglycerate mutase